MSKIHDSKILNYQIDFENLKMEMQVITIQEKHLKFVFGLFLCIKGKEKQRLAMLDKHQSYTIDRKNINNKAAPI